MSRISRLSRASRTTLAALSCKNAFLMMAARSRSLSGLYIILDPSICPARPLIEVLRTAAMAGCALFQYRNKTASMKDAYWEALDLRQAAAEAGVLFIVNDRCDLALAVDADGVHLGQRDLPFDLARKVMGQDKLIGISTHNPDQVREATIRKPDYLGFGPIFTPGSKQDYDPVVGLEGLHVMRRLTSLPVFAIGGIQIDHVRDVMRAGVDGVAVISAILKAPDISHAVKSFLAQM